MTKKATVHYRLKIYSAVILGIEPSEVVIYPDYDSSRQEEYV